MQIKIFGAPENTTALTTKVKTILEDLGLVDFINVEETQSDTLKQELNITQEPAFIIEEDSIDFRDVIFEGIIPNDEELKSMFISIVGGGEGGGCGSGGCGSGGCSTGGCGSETAEETQDAGGCGTGCGCH